MAKLQKFDFCQSYQVAADKNVRNKKKSARKFDIMKFSHVLMIGIFVHLLFSKLNLKTGLLNKTIFQGSKIEAFLTSFCRVHYQEMEKRSYF